MAVISSKVDACVVIFQLGSVQRKDAGVQVFHAKPPRNRKGAEVQALPWREIRTQMNKPLRRCVK